MRSFLFSLILFSVVNSAQAFECLSGWTPLWCRGPLTMELSQIPNCIGGESCYQRSFTQIHFNKNATGAGNSGEKLKPGSCAWPARPFYATENGALVTKWMGSAQTTDVFNVVNACSSDAKCAFALCARHSQTKGIFEALDTSVIRNFVFGL